jgi:DNA-binding NarL/FixJ family response regulator
MAYANRIRVLVLHDDPLARAGLSATFGRHQDLEVMDDDELDVEDMSATQPGNRVVDVVVADYENGVELATKVSRRIGVDGSAKIMIVASSDRECEIRHALERGVRGYVLMGCALEEIAHGVRAVHRGARFLSPQVALRLAESLSGEPLTTREEEVLRLVVEGMGNKLIARRMNIAVGTVKSHLKGVFDKLNVDSRTQAICAAERRGLLRDASPKAHSGEVSVPRASQLPHLPTAHNERGSEIQL